MTNFNRSTSRRLQKLTQIPSVWEGDRRPLSPPHAQFADPEAKGDCIIWVDASQGVVRSMDMVDNKVGPEAVVRTLMRAIEHPQSPAKPGRPQRIVVRDREIQFYLRGVLQDLDIAIDYIPELPIIDELFRSFAEVMDNQVPDLPPQYAQTLRHKALEMWELAPWEFLEEQQILCIEVNKWDVEKLYVSVMGMLGMEYGILWYRSEDSLKRFRLSVITDNDENNRNLEEAFLKQDCLFLTYESLDEEENEDNDLGNVPVERIEPTFGNIHPLEGLRSVLYEEEALLAFVALESLLRFFRDQRRYLYEEDFTNVSQRYRISLPKTDPSTKFGAVSVTVSTLPELAIELQEMAEMAWEDDDEEDIQPLRDDLIPEDSFLSLGVIPWESLDYLSSKINQEPVIKFPRVGDGLAVVVVQTSRPKAKIVIDKIHEAGGLNAISFNPGHNPFDGDRYDLGLLRTNNQHLFLFGEFLENDRTHQEARKKWDKRCRNNNGYCALIIAKGLTGASRGNPHLRDMMGFFPARFLTAKELGLGLLELTRQLDFE